MRYRLLTYSSLLSTVIAATAHAAATPHKTVEAPIEHVLITSDFRPESLQQAPASVSVLNHRELQQLGGDHFGDVLQTLPNLNYSGASARPKYFQIRGVGEQEDYEGAPNSSIGFYIDDIDLSGLGAAGTLYDIEQVELLRGPQGTRFGASALAGAIFMKSAAPTEQWEYGLQSEAGNDDMTSLAGYVSGPLTEHWSGRVAVQQHQQDGFVDNDFLGRDDTNQRDETTARVKTRWQPNENVNLDLTWFYADLDDGYDAWTLDNNGFTSISDEPGMDSQRTSAGSAHLDWQLTPTLKLVSISSYADTHHRYAYDGDWANTAYWASLSCGGQPCEYDYWWDKQGHRRNATQELRLQSTGPQGRIFAGHSDWLVGVYGARLSEKTDLFSLYNGAPDETRDSHYVARSRAAFGQLDTHFGDWVWSTGLRIERWDADYDDDHDQHFNPNETMWGGHLSLAYHFAPQQQIYLRVARGYKVGGFNMDVPVSLADHQTYGSETLYNYELGVDWLALQRRFSGHASLFYMDRDDQQVQASLQDPDNPQRFILFKNNAASTQNYGLELETRYQLSSTLNLWANASYLQTEYQDYALPDGNGGQLQLAGRDLAHAPHYQFATGARWQPFEHWVAAAYVTGMDRFYYSDSNDFQSHAYALYNARLGYQTAHWSLFLWGKNLTDKRYGTRGFYFGNEPNLDWADRRYVRYGDPRTFGLTFRYDYF